ncbi:MAG: molybdopterin-dependent oxidoreductase [Acidobacteriota bacterium]
MSVTRRDFLGLAAATGLGALAAGCQGEGFRHLVPLAVGNPLEFYPARDWESVYRDAYRCNDSFTFICAPNDTHLCRLRAFLRNGIVVRTEQNYGAGNVGDLYGNKSSLHWNPRGCLKGYTMHRRVYGPYRLRGPAVRAGWKEWADAGFPSLSDHPELRHQYRFDARSEDQFVRVSWDEIASYAARGLEAIARTYSGPEGKRRLLEKDGYVPEMLEHWEGAGTRTMKVGSCLPIHGVLGKFGLFRFANMMGLLDAHVRKVGPDKARAARDWTEYTWRGDQAPGHPFVTGLQTSDCDFNDLRHSRLHIQCGKNLVENKMPDSHWFIELMERGGKIVSISPDYNAPAAKSDYWIKVRAGLSDTAIFLYLARFIMENGHVNQSFVRRFTDLPLLLRTDTLTRIRAHEVIPGYRLPDLSSGPSFKIQGMTEAQRLEIGDFVVFDARTGNHGGVRALTRDQVGDRLEQDGCEPVLDWHGTLKTVEGKEIEAMTIYQAYRRHLKDYDLTTVAEITGADPQLLRRLARDLVTIRPAAIHIGEGINHYFHATLHNRAEYLPMLLMGEIGKPGAGVFAWAGNYKGAILQAAPWAGHGAGVYVKEDPFAPAVDPETPPDKVPLRNMLYGEEVGYWGSGDHPLIVRTPQGKKLFTGKTHLPTPTKMMWYNNANLLNQAKWHYELIRNVLPKIDMIVDQQIEWTGSAEHADLVLPANSWLEFKQVEAAGSCSNPFLQLWKGGVEPLFDSRDDAEIFATVARGLADLTGDERFKAHWKFITEDRPEVYLDRVFASCTSTRNKAGLKYTTADIMEGKYGDPGSALFLHRTYPRMPFYEQVHDSIPFYTDSGRLASYCDIPEAIEYGENFIVHREGPEATPYLPNVIVSENPLIRPADYGISRAALDADLRQVRNIKMPWREVKKSKNPFWEQGYRFFCSTPKSRHSVHSSWSVVDWNWIWSCNHGDPYRTDRRAPGVADRQIQMNPVDARELGLEDGDYCWVDANEADRPYVGWNKEKNKFLKRAARCMVRVKFNMSLPPGFTILKHTGWMSSTRTVRAAESRKDGRAFSSETGYQASYRYGSHQSITRAWMMPMHQTDTLFHKKAAAMGFVRGFEVDNHAINSAPKETLVRIVRAESGGLNGKGVWSGAQSGYAPDHESDKGQAYLAGALTKVKKS